MPLKEKPIMSRGIAKTRFGMVVSNKMDKTVVVDVVNMSNHPRYEKPIKRSSKFKAHDERGICEVGDKVLIIESSPISKTKRWRVSKIVEKSKFTSLNSDIEQEAEEGLN